MDSWDTDASSLVWFALPGLVVPGIFLVLAFWQPTRRQLDRWAVTCGVALTPGNLEQVRSHLARVRRFRSVAAFPFWALSASPILTGDDLPFPLSTSVAPIAAYVIGGLVAELTSRTAADGASRSTSLVPRTFDQYLPRWLQRLPWLLLGGAVILLAFGPRPADPATDRPDAVRSVLVAIVVTAVAEVAGRRVVARPQRGRDADVLAADDGLRATAVSATAASAGMAALLALSAAISALVASEMGWVAVPFLAGLLATNGVVVGFLLVIVRQETLGYRRRHRQAPVPVAA